MPQVTRPKDSITVPDKPFDGDVPALPRSAHIGPDVREWYDEISRLPHAGTWTRADWFSIREICLMKQKMFDAFEDDDAKSSGISNLASEIRRREDALGITTIGRRRAGIEYVPIIENELGARSAEKRKALRVS